MSKHDPNTEPPHHLLEKLGQGSFGTIYHYPTHPTVFKTIDNDDGDDNLWFEFNIYQELRTAIGAAEEPSVFRTPHPWAYWRPSSAEILPPTAAIPPSLSIFRAPTFLFDIIPSLSLDIVAAYQRLFIAPAALAQCPRIRLLRLYFGREDMPALTEEFQPGLSTDLPLDSRRYDLLRSAVTTMPTALEVSSGMGQVLARLHWAVGANARDVELVLGSRVVGGVPVAQCYVLDFNQCQRWILPGLFTTGRATTTGSYASGDLVAGAKRLAWIVSGQELYYPRPHQTEYYAQFKTGYLREVSDMVSGLDEAEAAQVVAAAEAFLSEFEALDVAKMERRSRRTFLQSANQ